MSDTLPRDWTAEVSDLRRFHQRICPDAKHRYDIAEIPCAEVDASLQRMRRRAELLRHIWYESARAPTIEESRALMRRYEDIQSGREVVE